VSVCVPARTGVPLPPDPEDPATEAAARAVAPEKFTFLSLGELSLVFTVVLEVCPCIGIRASFGSEQPDQLPRRDGRWCCRAADAGEGLRLGGWAESTWNIMGRVGYWHSHLHPPPVMVGAVRAPRCELRAMSYAPHSSLA
jgi:hypothetical protein